MNGFWTKLPKGFMVLAPMEDVTDTVFRQIMLQVSRPSVMFTEFANVDGIAYASRNLEKSILERPQMQRLVYKEIERPIVAQIWGTDPDSFEKAAGVVADLGFDGIDINFGCPAREVVKGGACSAMIGKTEIVGQIIEATKRGAKGLPISVKTRLGYKKPITEEWIGFLLTQGLAAITVHGRIGVEMSKYPAKWDEIGKAVNVRNIMGSKTLIVGNGDVLTHADAQAKIEKYGVDGVMVARGVFQNPTIFKSDEPMTKDEKIGVLKKHIALWVETWGEKKHFAVMKKFVKMYVNGFDGASEQRMRLMDVETAEEMQKILDEI